MRCGAISVIIAVVSTVVSLFLLELGIRTFLPAYNPSENIVFHSVRGVVTAKRPGPQRQATNNGDFNVSVDISDIGLRESKDLGSATPRDIFVVGDSYTFGWGVEEAQRYSNRLEALLPGRRTFTVAGPASDIAAYQRYVRYARDHGGDIHSLVVGICMENDLREYGPQDANVSYSSEKPTSHGLQYVKDWLRDRSAVYFALTSVVHSSDSLRRLAQSFGIMAPDQLPGTAQLDPYAITTSVAETRKLLAPFQGVVLIVPSRGLWVGGEERRALARKTHDAYVAGLREAGLTVVDPRAAFEASGDPLSHHFPHDGHWNARGHQVAAELLAEAFLATAQVSTGVVPGE